MIEILGMTSPNVLKLVLMLEECGLAYRLRHVDVFAGEQRTPEFLALNPSGKVPVLIDHECGVVSATPAPSPRPCAGVHREAEAGQEAPAAEPEAQWTPAQGRRDGGAPFAVFESAAGLLYLAERAGRFLQTEAMPRSIALQWLMFQTASIGPMFGQYVHFFRYAPTETYGLKRYESEVARLLGVLDTRLAQSPWLAGDDYGLADIATWPWIRTADAMFPLLTDGRDRWRGLPALRRWFERVAERPATPRATAALDALLPADRAAFGRADADALDRFFGRGRHDHSHKLTGAETAQ
ncbi:glutathione S-transferase C-terminal domain-containing protein [Sphingomonas lycopersici]|uniref:Glutathione S-transferase C-terminal domain-containing protein n=1 Tax=Sphingomonas lycopersici TaxID=2951807 RepID=A0AA41ZDA4_9SPHN|nr:glutathione S-transferase C-terminal domain-containing protein [Sphingomonas lycopersici]MCW6534774.1 glutathione S-transferase C-terminal domain-containing protein [Sphingomonas lycopersici]